MLALTGVGTAIRFMPGTLHGVAYYRNNIAPMVSILMLAGSMGGALGLTVMGNIFNSRMSSAGFSFSSTNTGNLNAIYDLPDAAQQLLVNTAKNAIVLAFYAITAFGWLGLVLMLGLGNVSIGRKDKGEKEKKDDKVWMGSYPVGLLMRRQNGWRIVGMDGELQPVEL